MAEIEEREYPLSMSAHRLIAIDPSLTCTGWAMFHTNSERLLAVGKIKAQKPPIPMAERLRDLQAKIDKLYDTIDLCTNDVLVCEAPTTMRDPRAALVVEQVRGLFETLARSAGAVVPGRINPRSVQYEVMGLKGRQQKRDDIKSVARELTIHLYGERLDELGLMKDKEPLTRHQDIIDAILLGVYGISKVQQAEQTGEPWERFFSQNERRSSTRRHARL